MPYNIALLPPCVEIPVTLWERAIFQPCSGCFSSYPLPLRAASDLTSSSCYGDQLIPRHGTPCLGDMLILKLHMLGRIDQGSMWVCIPGHGKPCLETSLLSVCCVSSSVQALLPKHDQHCLGTCVYTLLSCPCPMCLPAPFLLRRSKSFQANLCYCLKTSSGCFPGHRLPLTAASDLTSSSCSGQQPIPRHGTPCLRDMLILKLHMLRSMDQGSMWICVPGHGIILHST